MEQYDSIMEALHETEVLLYLQSLLLDNYDYTVEKLGNVFGDAEFYLYENRLETFVRLKELLVQIEK